MDFAALLLEAEPCSFFPPFSSLAPSARRKCKYHRALQRAVLIVDEQRLIVGIADQAIELIDRGARERLRRDFQAQVVQAALLELFSGRAVILGRRANVQHRAIAVCFQPGDAASERLLAAGNVGFDRGELRDVHRQRGAGGAIVTGRRRLRCLRRVGPRLRRRAELSAIGCGGATGSGFSRYTPGTTPEGEEGLDVAGGL